MNVDIIGGGDCGKNDCPTVFVEEATGSAIVQGYVLTADESNELGIKSGEAAVRIPEAVLREAARKLV